MKKFEGGAKTATHDPHTQGVLSCRYIIVTKETALIILTIVHLQVNRKNV